MSRIVPRISVHIMLPEAVDRRFRRKVENLPGASWPTWGGHVTLVPPFVPSCPPEEVFDRVAAAVQSFTAFRLRLGAAVVEDDVTRPQFHAVFIQVDEVVGEDPPVLSRLQQAVASALAPVRQEANPKLEAIPFTPHLTLALGVGDSEARRLVNAWRNDPLEAEFGVDAVWLVLMWPDAAREQRIDRIPIALAKPPLSGDTIPPGTLSD